jgi:carotenoid cleavage dioxygenase-like enzyme
VTLVRNYTSDLPADDAHPYRTGAWRPQKAEHTSRDLRVTGTIPRELNGVYLRNTENPLFTAIGRYHPFDGDGMIHTMSFSEGEVEYRNRFVQTDGLRAEMETGHALWAGLAEPPSRSLRDGKCARGQMKDASSTDIVVHAGVRSRVFISAAISTASTRTRWRISERKHGVVHFRRQVSLHTPKWTSEPGSYCFSTIKPLHHSCITGWCHLNAS